jgi:hypothetical protein
MRINESSVTAVSILLTSIMISALPASACVTILRGSGAFPMVVNNCPYTVIVSFTTGSGFHGTTSAMGPGSEQSIYASQRDAISIQWCNFEQWNKNLCRL